MKRLLLPCLLLAGCGACPDTTWSRYLWITIAGLPSTTHTATLRLVSERFGDHRCTAGFGAGTDGDFADIVEEDCPDAMAHGTYITEWFVGYPARRSPPFVELALSFEDDDGTTGGFDLMEVDVDWDRQYFPDGPACPHRAVGHVLLDPSGEPTWLP